MNTKKNTSARPGIALLIVLIIVMAIAITAMGFLSQSDVELACGQNMLMRTQMDYLAESGLEHARGLILNPQDVAADYWDQPRVFQLVPGSNDYYDVTVIRDANDRCNYTIGCNSYRMKDADRIGMSRLHAHLRLDPCIAYWVGGDTTIPSQVAITGDVYCGGTLINNSNNIKGDAFATGVIIGMGTTTGRKNESVAADYPVAWPELAISTTYYLGTTPYSAAILDDANALTGTYDPTSPAGILYCIGNATMPGGATINGTLVVNGDLTISGPNNVITPVNTLHFPALLVSGQIVMKNGGSLVVNGLAQVSGPMTFDPDAISANVQVTGGLFISTGGIQGITSSFTGTVSVIAAPEIASIEIWPGGTSKRWSPAAGAFFKSIERIK